MPQCGSDGIGHRPHGVKEGSEGTITSRDAIAVQNAAREALRGLGQWLSDGGRSSPRGKGKARQWEVSAFNQCLGVLIWLCHKA